MFCCFKSLLAVAVASNSTRFNSIVESVVKDLDPVTSGAATKWASEILGHAQGARFAAFPHYTRTDSFISPGLQRADGWDWECYCERTKALRFRAEWRQLKASEKLYTRCMLMSRNEERFQAFSYYIDIGPGSRYTSRSLCGPRAFSRICEPAYGAAWSNDVEKLQRLFSVGQATPWDRDKNMDLLIAVRIRVLTSVDSGNRARQISANAGAHDVTRFLLEQGSPVRDAHW
jgi:hypothetical protein